MRELNKLDLAEMLKNRLSWEQQQMLNQEAPTHFRVPSGSKIRIDYQDKGAPVLPVRIQELFGLAGTPTICSGRVRLLLHLLSPARRPMQVTDDLAGFWQNSYHLVKKELAGRYPKHHWPDDPINARPTRGVRRKPK
jgi:ATP-dependent helicase HrpB